MTNKNNNRIMTKIKGDRTSVKRKQIKDSQTELSESTRSKRRQERQQRTTKGNDI